MKIDINKVTAILQKNKIEPAVLRRVIEEVNLAAQPVGGGEAEPKQKKQYVIVLSDPEGKLREVGNGFLGWVTQIEEGGNPGEVVDRVKAAAIRFNESKRGRKVPVKTLGEAFESMPARFFKDEVKRTSVKTKVPVYVAVSDNKL